MSRFRSRPGRAPAYLANVALAMSPAFLLMILAIILTAFISTDFYVLEVLVLAVIYMQFASSWDVLCGYANQDNFGLALFTGVAGYCAALMNKSLGLAPWLTIPASALFAALIGLAIGYLVLRLRGAYFSLLTIVAAAVLFKCAYIFAGVAGGEEGISGIDSFTYGVATDLLVCTGLLLVSVFCMTAFARSHYGLILRATQHNEDAAIASGINTAHYKIVGFAVSAFFAGIGGAMFAHTQMQVNPELMAISLSVLVVLMAVIGGRGTIIGPVFAAAVLIFFDEWLRVIENYRPILFTGTLIVLIYAFPSGIAHTGILQRARRLRRFLLGREV
ncbi:MAG TPA: branched-chain amino acid ABC transporter permease [Castellaniella sp.]|nr:branched-chain amino acid ABC transporter permease [Castellaniella sp.]